MDHAKETPQAPTVQPQATEATPGTQPEHVQAGPSSGEGNGAAGRDTRFQSSSTHLLHAASEGHPTQPQSNESPYTDFERVAPPPPARSRDGHVRVTSRHRNIGHFISPRNGSVIDHIVPMDEKSHTRRTVGERLLPTINNAVKERDKYARKVLWTGYALNIAIGLQVFLGALTTGLAAALTSGRQAQVSTAILGGIATMVASYMARARGSGEPELSITRVKDLEQFLRDCRAFQMDYGHEYGNAENGLDYRLEGLRRQFEELLGNANGERKLSPVGITAAQTVP